MNQHFVHPGVPGPREEKAEREKAIIRNEQLSSENLRLNLEISNLRSQNRELQKVIEEYKLKINDLEKNIDFLRTKINTNELEIKELKKDLEYNLQIISRLENNNFQTFDKIKNLKIEELKVACVQIQKNIDVLTSNNEKIKNDIYKTQEFLRLKIKEHFVFFEEKLKNNSCYFNIKNYLEEIKNFLNKEIISFIDLKKTLNVLEEINKIIFQSLIDIEKKYINLQIEYKQQSKTLNIFQVLFFISLILFLISLVILLKKTGYIK